MPNAGRHLLNPQDARLFRITHIDNVPWLLDHGLHCQSSAVHDPNFVPIGMPSLIDKRRTHPVPIAPRGVLADYVPFYFTPWSVMLKNIRTGYGGVIQRPANEIVILGALLPELSDRGLTAIFTNGHAYMRQTRYFNDLAELEHIDWAMLQAKNFKRDENDVDKSRRYQAEALVRNHVPFDAVAAIGCNSPAVQNKLNGWLRDRGMATKTLVKPDWYF